MSSITVYKDVEVEVNIDIDDLLAQANTLEKSNLARALGVPSNTIGVGEGDDTRLRGIVAAAERAVRALPQRPRELEDLFWHVHGVAL